jgi:predicted transcriptional regulator
MRDPGEERPAPHHAHAGDTEAGAADFIKSTAGKLRVRVVDQLQANPAGLTACELAEKLDAYLYSVAPRITELQKGGRVEDSGRRRPSDRGRPSVVWRLVPDLDAYGDDEELL